GELCDECGVRAEGAVPHSPMGFVAGIARADQLTAQGRPQLGISALVEPDALPGGARHGCHGRSITAGRVPCQELGFHPYSWMSRAGSAITIWSRPGRTTPSCRSSRRTRTTNSRAVATA